MKKKIVTLLMVSSLAFSITACGEKQVESEKNVSFSEESQDIQVESQEVTTAADDSTTGTVVQGDGFTKTPVITDKELNYTGNAGPMNYSIDAIQISNLVATTDDAARMFGVEKNKETAIIAMDITAENTSDEDISFYISQATLISNTKEQVDPNMLFSDYIDGDFLGTVKKSGSLIYILPNSNANEITSIKLRISAPTDSEWNSLSDEISIELAFE